MNYILVTRSKDKIVNKAKISDTATKQIKLAAFWIVRKR